jgi:FkbH-like protein
MYETEINQAVESAGSIPREIAEAFAATSASVRVRSVLPWSEHCTECVWPTCYTTCDLYEARPDGKCRRFADGMVRIDLPRAANSYILKIRFKRWGKLWTPGNVNLHSAEKARWIEGRDYAIGRTLQRIPVQGLVKIAAGKRYGFKKKMAAATAENPALPSSFLVECYNPEARRISLSLVMRAEVMPADGMQANGIQTNATQSKDTRGHMPFQKLIELEPGYNRVRVPFPEIAALLDVSRPFGIELVPNDDRAEPTTLFFGLMEFIREVAESKEERQPGKDAPAGKNDQKTGRKSKKIKCIVWDLDNTLWEGVLVEDGRERLRLKPGIAEIIKDLDARGILHSIASKNNHDEALEVLRGFGLEEYFLAPQISWNPKSQSIQAIARQLNIGIDSLLFVDDSTFELEQVKAVCPDVQLLGAEQYRALLEKEECRIPVTDESRDRRKMYQVEMSRQTIAESFNRDYMAFLRHCAIRLQVRVMTEENLERVHELTQRTNQMNFSGNRYDREVLRGLLSNPDFDTFVLSCEDRFGSYGVVGFSVVERREARMTDLMFSCRIQSKRVEHAFLAYILRKYIADTGKDFYANYRKTPRNAPSGQVFADMGMETVATTEGVLSLRFGKEQSIQEDGVIQIVTEDALVGVRA